jgi:hypothetical protein
MMKIFVAIACSMAISCVGMRPDEPEESDFMHHESTPPYEWKYDSWHRLIDGIQVHERRSIESRSAAVSVRLNPGCSPMSSCLRTIYFIPELESNGCYFPSDLSTCFSVDPNDVLFRMIHAIALGGGE